MGKDPWDVLPVTAKDVATATRDDRVYGKLLNAVRSGHVNPQDADLKPFSSLLHDFHIEQDVLFFGARIIVPTVLQARLLEELHQTHMGAAKMKETSRKYFWWPKITAHIDNLVKRCLGCSKFRRKSPNTVSCPWPFARRPMERVHIDYCEYRGKMLFVMIDAYTKYIWCRNMNCDTTSTATLVTLYEWFTECSGFPATLVSDNGTNFASREFSDHMKTWGIKHLFSPPHHPASNGLAEKAVHIVKDKLKKCETPAKPLSLQAHLTDILRIYRGTIHSTTVETPYELMQHHPAPSLFPQLQIKQHKDIVMPNKSNRKTFKLNDKVLVYDKLSKLSSVGVVVAIKSRNSYSVKINGIIKHISGDNMSHSELSDNNSITSDDVDTLSDTSSAHDYSDDDDSIIDVNDQPVVLQPQLQAQPQRQLQLSPRRTRSGRRY